MSAGRLSFWQAASVIARRDFTAVLFSRSFLLFLLGPLFPLIVGALAGGVSSRVATTADQAHIGVAMVATDADAMLAAHGRLAPQLGTGLPDMVILRQLKPGESYDPHAALSDGNAGLGAVLTGTLDAPVLTGTADRIGRWQGPVSFLAGNASAAAGPHYPQVTLSGTKSSSAQRHANRLLTAQAAQTLLFLLIMLLAGMVLSNLVEEKTNKIIEILASAIPMDAVFFGKLFAMLGVSLVGIAAWGAVGGAIVLLAGHALPALPEPAVGWPIFFALGTIYFAMGYLLLGALFLTIGSMASTVREVQTLSMPVTMMQLLVFFFASYAMAQPGSTIEWLAVIFPPSSPFAMLARAAQENGLWQHVIAVGWQGLAVALFVKAGAGLFRKRVMQSGPAPRKAAGRGLLARLKQSRA